MILGSRLFAVTLDCPDPHALARFYREIVGGDLRSSNDDFVVLSGTDSALRLDFQRVQNSEPIPWPDPAATRRLHLDFVVDDLDEAEAHLCSMGARRADSQPGGDRFRVLIDPAGHPFCLATAQAASTPSGQVPEVDTGRQAV
ncbi:VOC family protein [Pseudonocardia alaniniphila]|uniref:VOC family protein n=1 Tax=Pseudonocardia alaniniphila TaxID=75291 RepID=A0ABS9TQ49_9PSEU|nr:VOC family protein [Pseudonocardia alaniniphila]MCH6170672.1 VOC family protein [Pseudonocardia alaniniphila]